jgi:type IV secretion system protein VirB10
VALAWAADPNFSGSWKLNPEESDIRYLPASPAETLTIEHNGNVIRCLDTAWTVDGKESRHQRGENLYKSILKWEGAALLINTIVVGPRHQYTQMDRWRLSRDRNTLTIRRVITRPGGESESTLVYEREGAAATAIAQSEPPPAPALSERQGAGTAAAGESQPPPSEYHIDKGSKVALLLINSLSTKHALEGDRVYLETAFPVVSGGRIVVPPGSWVAGTVTHVKRPGRVKGKGELFLRFDTLTLPNGVTRDFRSRIGTVDGQTRGDFDRTEGKISSESNKAGDAQTVGEATAAGASVGVIAGGATGHYGMGTMVGAAAGAAAGLMGVLLSRGPEVVLPKGSTLEMVLDRDLVFSDQELKFDSATRRTVVVPAQPQQDDRRTLRFPGRRFPL